MRMPTDKQLEQVAEDLRYFLAAMPVVLLTIAVLPVYLLTKLGRRRQGPR